MQKDAQQLDTRVRVVTPENIAFQYRVAGPFHRLPAYLIDLAIRVLIIFVANLVLSLLFHWIGLGSIGEGVWLILFFVLTWFYGGLFETFWNGQTPGKRLLRIRVLSVEGQAINASQAVLRNVLRVVDGLPPPCLYMVGLVAASMNDRYQRLGDLACGTMVVREEPHWLTGVAAVNEPEVIRLGNSVPASFQPSHSLARALAVYVGRRANFTPARRIQIARYLGVPLRERFKLPQETNLDHLLCALYNRAFVTDEQPEQIATEPTDGDNPFSLVAELQPAESIE